MRKIVLVLLGLLLFIPKVIADGLTDRLGSIWDKVLIVGDLSSIGLGSEAVIVNFTRLLLAILAFALFFAVLTGFKGKSPFQFINRNQAMVISGVLAVMAAIFLPIEVILATGGAWATAVAAILIGGPVAGLGFLLWQIPGTGKPETRATAFLKLVLCFVLFWILSVMRHHLASGLTT